MIGNQNKFTKKQTENFYFRENSIQLDTASFIKVKYNITVISWQSVLLVGETGVSRENNDGT
jgi:hypothetical protein